MFLFKKSLLLLAIILLVACKQKKKPSLSGDDPVEAVDFIGFFNPLPLSYQVGDTILNKKDNDSLLISRKVFNQFVPDSVLEILFGKGEKPKIYPAGKVEVPKAETYLFIKAVNNTKKILFLVAFDKMQQYIASLPVIIPDQKAATEQSLLFDKKYTITKAITKKNADGSVNEGKDVYVLNESSKSFLLIMTDALEDKITELINPIDTFPRTHKLAADYGTGKMNLVSIRDGRKNDRLTFFVHFEKNNGDCVGELKGEAILISPNVAEYREKGDPCYLKFNFSSNAVVLQEESCGSQRGMKCLFDGNFPRKKLPKPKAEKTKPPVKNK